MVGNDSGNDGMEIVAGSFNVEHTSSKAPKDLLEEIKRVLALAVVHHTATGAFQMMCSKQNTRFKVEVGICIFAFLV